MKLQRNHLAITVLSFTLLLSCTVEKRLYNKGYSVQRRNSVLAEKHADSEKEVTDQDADNFVVPEMSPETFESPVVPEYQSMTETTSEEEPLCDSIRMRNGNLKIGTIKEVNATEVRYKNCDGSGPIYVLQKTDVKSIKYSDGKEEVYVSAEDTETKKPGNQQEPELECFGLIGFICSLIGLFFAGLPLSILAIIFGMISIGRSVNHPSKYKGKAFGVLSLIFGFVLLILMLVLLL